MRFIELFCIHLVFRCNIAGLWKRLEALKVIKVEPASTKELENEIQGYRSAIENGRGGLFFAVCRGKVCLRDSAEHALTAICACVMVCAFVGSHTAIAPGRQATRSCA